MTVISSDGRARDCSSWGRWFKPNMTDIDI